MQLDHSDPGIRREAVVALERFLPQSVEGKELAYSRIAGRLLDPDRSVAQAALRVLRRWAELDTSLGRLLDELLKDLLASQATAAADKEAVVVGPQSGAVRPSSIPTVPLIRAAERLEVKVQVLRRLAQQDMFGKKVGRNWLASEDDIANFHTVKPVRGRPKNQPPAVNAS